MKDCLSKAEREEMIAVLSLKTNYALTYLEKLVDGKLQELYYHHFSLQKEELK